MKQVFQKGVITLGFFLASSTLFAQSYLVYPNTAPSCVPPLMWNGYSCENTYFYNDNLTIETNVDGSPLKVRARFYLGSSCQDYNLSWGDGTNSNYNNPPYLSCIQSVPTDPALVTHFYQRAGTYTVTLQTGANTVSKTITVGSPTYNQPVIPQPISCGFEMIWNGYACEPINTIPDYYGLPYITDSYPSLDSTYYFESIDMRSSCAPAIYRNLSQGSSGEDVYTLQDFLHDAGYLAPAPNGYFGPATKVAVQAFQYQKGISMTGTVGPQTRNALNDAICGGDYDAYGNLGSVHGDRMINLGRTYEPIFEGEVPTRVVEIPTTYVTAQTANIYTSHVASAPRTEIIRTPSTVQTVAPIRTSAPVATTVGTFVPNLNTLTQTNIQYYPYDPFSNNPLPLPATLVIGNPLNNSIYKEGDVINANWAITNANVIRYVVSFESSTNRIAKELGVFPGTQNSTSFTLDKALLDYVCGGECDMNEQKSFKFNVTAVMAGNHGATSNIKAYTSPITVVRPYTYGYGVDLQTSKTPINSGEEVDLLVSTPLGHAWSNGLFGPFTVTVRATCPQGVYTNINGIVCGTYTATQNSIYTYFFPTIKAVLTNTTVVPQVVRLDLTVTNSATGEVIGQDVEYIVVQRSI